MIREIYECLMTVCINLEEIKKLENELAELNED